MRAAKCCSLPPRGAGEPSRALKIIAKVDYAGDSRATAVLGQALFRSGRFDESVHRLLQAIDKLPPRDSFPHEQWYWLAMAYHGLGRKDDAHRWLRKAVEWPEIAGDRIYWEHSLRLRLLRREAEAVIKR